MVEPLEGGRQDDGGSGDQARARGQPLPVHGLPQHRQVDRASRGRDVREERL